MGIDMKKEIKLSDLFKRGPKEPKAEKPPKEPKPAKPPKEPRERRFGRGKPKEKTVAVAEKEAAPVRDIPLMRAFNLLPKEEARAEKESRQSALPHIIVALAGVLVFAALAAVYLSSSAAVTKKTGQLDDVRGDLASLQVPEQQPGQAQGATNIADQRSARTQALAQALADRVAWDRILREIALVLPDDIHLATLDSTTPSAGSASASTTPGPTTFRITGDAVAQASVARLLSRLEVIPELKTVRLEYAKIPDTPAGAPVSFSITAVVRQGASA
jgi:Tfp pilus assembly protein PilN